MVGLLLPRNKLVYPASRAEINRDHPASAKLRYAGVPQGDLFVNLMNGVTGTIGGTPVRQAASIIGGAVNFPSGASCFDTSTAIADIPSNGLVFGAIVTPHSTSTSFGSIVITGTFGGNDWGITNNGGFFALWGKGTTSRSPNVPAYIADRPYFTAFCAYPSASAGDIFFAQVLTDLRTGQVYFGTVTGAQSITAAFGSAKTYVGGFPSFSSNALLSAAMFSVSPIRPTELLAWGHDPWSFWYPQTTKRTIFSGLQYVPPAFVPPGNGKGNNGNGKGKGNGKGNGGNNKPPKNVFDPYGRYEAYFERRDEQQNLRRARRRSAVFGGSIFDSSISLNVVSAVSSLASVSFDKSASFNVIAALSDALGSSFDVAAVFNIVAAMSESAVLSLSPAATLATFMGQASAAQLDARAASSLNVVARETSGASVDMPGAATFNTVARASAGSVLTAEAAATLAAIIATAAASQLDATAAVTLNAIANALASVGNTFEASATIDAVLGQLAQVSADLQASASLNTALDAQPANSITIDGAVSLGALLGLGSFGGAALEANTAISVTLRSAGGASIDLDEAAEIIASLGLGTHPNAPRPIADVSVIRGTFDTRLVLSGEFKTAADLSGVFEIVIDIDGRTLN